MLFTRPGIDLSQGLKRNALVPEVINEMQFHEIKKSDIRNSSIFDAIGGNGGSVIAGRPQPRPELLIGGTDQFRRFLERVESLAQCFSHTRTI